MGRYKRKEKQEKTRLPSKTSLREMCKKDARDHTEKARERENCSGNIGEHAKQIAEDAGKTPKDAQGRRQRFKEKIAENKQEQLQRTQRGDDRRRAREIEESTLRRLHTCGEDGVDTKKKKENATSRVCGRDR
ncbi:hypothetical protein PoB_005606800 [Plakobranchus ocellatus]|uniref:Uncharacterized protein n=1 Tax=Plakobranchus ocellatus TaxID=259542 RepID=A0AAV4CF18_9GAST|nr:hypothetical protein PoB_005606800 [Plakobranchus ocellatus]